MRRQQALGTVVVVVAALLGAALAMGLLQWETADRARQTSYFPTQTPLPAPSPTPSIAAGTSATTPAPGAAIAGVRGDPAAGATVFAAKCGACHPGAKAGTGPALHGPAFAARYPEDAPLEQIIRQGRDGMPGFGDLSAADLANLISYLRSLP